MSVQTDLDIRISKLRNILTGINTALVDKDGTAVSSLSELPAAIQDLSGDEDITWHEYEIMPKDYDFHLTVPEGHGIREVTILGDADLLPENIRKGITLFDVAGAYVGYITVASADNLPADAEDGTIAVVEG